MEQLQDIKFADPIFDISFKMIFGSENNEDILISLINSLLDFEGENQVKSVEYLPQELSVDHPHEMKILLDLRCITNKDEEIIIEMQRIKNKDLLSRSQYYMSRVLSYKMKRGKSRKYRLEVPKVYIIILSSQNIFTSDWALNNDFYYEKTVVPMIKEMLVEIPENSMNWKFFEFERFYNDRGKYYEENMTENLMSLKEQWCYFFYTCATTSEIPSYMDPIIKKAYKIMQIASWTRRQVEDYENAVIKFQNDQDKITDARDEGMKEGKKQGMREGMKEGKKQGMKEGIIKGEISTIKVSLRFGHSAEQIIPYLKYLSHENLKDKIEKHIDYIARNSHLSEKEICHNLGILNDLADCDFDLD